MKTNLDKVLKYFFHVSTSDFKKSERLFLQHLELAKSSGGISKQEYTKIKTIYNGKGTFSIKFKKINNIIKVKGAKK